MGFLSLINFIEDTYKFKAADSELLEENFESVNAIVGFISKKLNKSVDMCGIAGIYNFTSPGKAIKEEELLKDAFRYLVSRTGRKRNVCRQKHRDW